MSLKALTDPRSLPWRRRPRWIQPFGATRGRVFSVVRIGGAGVARLGRPGGLSAAGKKELWERWKTGESISDIARALHKPPGSIHGMLQATGGISPPQRRRRRCALTPPEREEISRGLASGESLRAIAARLGRCASSVCREVNCNGGRRNYRGSEGGREGVGESPPSQEMPACNRPLLA